MGFTHERGSLAPSNRECLEMLMPALGVAGAGVEVETVGNSSDPNKTFCY